MLVLTIHVDPGGYKALRREITRIEIANITELAPISDYECKVFSDGGKRAKAKFYVRGHRRDDGALSLVQKVLEEAVRTCS